MDNKIKKRGNRETFLYIMELKQIMLKKGVCYLRDFGYLRENAAIFENDSGGWMDQLGGNN